MNQILSSDEPGEVYKFQFLHRLKLFIVYFLSLMLSYFLMLIVMTFNAGLFVAAVMGLTFGYYIFGFVRKRGYTKIYYPETDKCCT